MKRRRTPRSNGDDVHGAVAGKRQQQQHRMRSWPLVPRWSSNSLSLALLVLLLLGRPAAATTEPLLAAGASAAAAESQGGVASGPLWWGAGILRRLLGQERASLSGDGGTMTMTTAVADNNNQGRRLAEDSPEPEKGSAVAAQAGGSRWFASAAKVGGAVASGGQGDPRAMEAAAQAAAVAAQAAGGFAPGEDAPGLGGKERPPEQGGGGNEDGNNGDGAAELGEDEKEAAAPLDGRGIRGAPEERGEYQDPAPAAPAAPAAHAHAHAHEAAQVAAQVAAAAANRVAEASDGIVGKAGGGAEDREEGVVGRALPADNTAVAVAASAAATPQGADKRQETGLLRARKWWSKKEPRGDNGGGGGGVGSGGARATSDGVEHHQQQGDIAAAAAAGFGEGVGVYGAGEEAVGDGGGGGGGGDGGGEAPQGAAGNETQAKSLMDAKAGLDNLRNIETEVEKHVKELLGLFTAENKGGRKYQAAALGVQQEVEDIRSELVKLLRTLNTTNAGILGAEHELQKKDLELVQLHAIEEVEGAKGKLTGGLVKVDYATGEIQWDGDGAKGDKAGAGAASLDGKGAGAGGAGGNQAIDEKLKSSEWRKEVNPEEWDPALLHLDSNLLLDFVVLCMSAALGGVLAAGVGLPETLGYIMGGMVVGPSGANVIYKVKEVETFAQFGSIFLLFGHGLTYSTFMNTGRQNSNVYAPQGRMGAFTVLFVVFSALLVCAAVLGIEDGVESVFLSAAATLSSTAMVTEFVAHSRLGDTVFARMVVDLVAVQDLIMCPLLAIPTAIMYALEESEGTGNFVPRIVGCAILLLAFVMASRRVLPIAMARLVLKDKKKEQSSGLFTLGVVSYCLGVALVCERLNLSHEAGALFAGLLMVDSPFAKKAHACMQPLTSLFGGMYLGSLGMIVNPAFMVWNFGDVLGCVVLLVLIKSLIVAMVMKSFGFSWEASTLAGACMAQVSEISLFFVARAQHLKLIRRHHYLMAVATTIILMVASPLVIKGLQAIHGGAAFGSGPPAAAPRVGTGGPAGSAVGGGGLSSGDHEESGLQQRGERGGSKGVGVVGGGKDVGSKTRPRGGSMDNGSGGGDNAAGEAAEGQGRLRFRRAVPE